jgi:hypothetical protein
MSDKRGELLAKWREDAALILAQGGDRGKDYAAGVTFCADELEATLRALTPLDGWQPIESAPKDGTAVLGVWMPFPGVFTRVTGNNYGITAYDDERGHWNLVDDGDEPDEVMRPDYWQPLPAAPTTQPSGETE